MRCLALLSLVFASGGFFLPAWSMVSLVSCQLGPRWTLQFLSGFGIRCYTRGLIGGSPRRRRQSESVKEEEPLLLFCADNQICMISGATSDKTTNKCWNEMKILKCQKCFVGNTGNPFAAQACVELLPGYPPENCRVPSRIEKYNISLLVVFENCHLPNQLKDTGCL